MGIFIFQYQVSTCEGVGGDKMGPMDRHESEKEQTEWNSTNSSSESWGLCMGDSSG